jgi:hypothetical protein
MRRLLGSLLIIIAIIVAVGIWRGWFNFRSQSAREDENRTTFSVDVNRNQIERDTAAVERSARQVGERIKEDAHGLAGDHTARGTIARIGAMEKHVLVRTSDNKELIVEVEPATRIIENEQPIQLDGLREGERVLVTYSTRDGKNIAGSITILPAS